MPLMRILPPEKTGTILYTAYTGVYSVCRTTGPIPLLDKDPKTLKGMYKELLRLG